ncbi:hypothetical protein BUE80_DR000905 [Diplocarpon rosae]|nr:hypothetical protein BUE80_DR000905 [Diplocarpon rosae]
MLGGLAALLSPLAVFALESGSLACSPPLAGTCKPTPCPESNDYALKLCSHNCDNRVAHKAECCEGPSNKADMFCTLDPA